MKSDISQTIARPSSYLETENLEIQEQVINLGKRLLNSFQNNDPDEITVWMINYLAEQIELAQKTGCTHVKKKCFKTILQLWEAHSSFPNGSRPFESFEPIFKVLDSLSPESPVPRYFSSQMFAGGKSLDGLPTWLELASQLDSTARTLISFMFEQAVDGAIDEETREWIKTLSGTVDCNEVDFVVRFMEEKSLTKDQERIDKLEKRVGQLKAFEDISQTAREELQREIQKLKSEN